MKYILLILCVHALHKEIKAQNNTKNTKSSLRYPNGFQEKKNINNIRDNNNTLKTIHTSDSTKSVALSSRLNRIDLRLKQSSAYFDIKNLRELNQNVQNAPKVINLIDPQRGGVFVLDEKDAYTGDDGGTVIITKSKLRYKRFDQASISPKWFGAKGNGIDDDTESLKITLNRPQSTRVLIPTGSYKTQAISLPNAGVKNTEQNSQHIYYLIGEAGGYSTSSLQATEGVNTLLTINNAAGIVISNLTLRGAPDTKNILDLSWKGTPKSGVAPTNLNKLENIWIEGGTGSVALNLDQFHDSKIDGITVRTKAEYALSLIGGGGYWGASNMQLYGGKARLASQNASIKGTVFTKGVEIVGGSYNFIYFDACHFIDITDSAIKSLAVGNGTRSLEFSTCFFNKSLTDNGFIEGRFWSGATFKNCWFESGKLTKNIIPAAGLGIPPRFRFENCSFGSAISPPINCVYEFINCTSSNGTIINYTTKIWNLGPGIETQSLLLSSNDEPASIELRNMNGSTPFIDFSQTKTSDYDTRLIQTDSGLNILGKGLIVGSKWNEKNILKIGLYSIWIDFEGRLRIKNGKPLNDKDGMIVGQQ